MVPSQIVDSNLQTIQKLLGIDSDHSLGLEPSQMIAEGFPVAATKRLSAVESDRLYRLARIVAKAADVFGDETTALSWLKEPLSALRGQTPLEVVKTEPGVQQVELLLGRIEHGIFA